VVDPIDGTRAFIDRTPNFAVCIAIIEKGESIAGVVFNPLKDELYEASLGGGARLNGATINVTAPKMIEVSRAVKPMQPLPSRQNPIGMLPPRRSSLLKPAQSSRTFAARPHISTPKPHRD